MHFEMEPKYSSLNRVSILFARDYTFQNMEMWKYMYFKLLPLTPQSKATRHAIPSATGLQIDLVLP